MVEYNNTYATPVTDPWGPTVNVRHEEEPAYTPPNTNGQTWSCPQCTLCNPVTARTCEACSYAVVTPTITSPATAGDEGILPDTHQEEPLAKKMRRRRRRRGRMVVGAGAGLVLGTIVFCGPWGAIFGAAAGAGTARVLSKRGERKKDLRTFYATDGGQQQQGQLLDPKEGNGGDEFPSTQAIVH